MLRVQPQIGLTSNRKSQVTRHGWLANNRLQRPKREPGHETDLVATITELLVVNGVIGGVRGALYQEYQAALCNSERLLARFPAPGALSSFPTGKA